MHEDWTSASNGSEACEGDTVTMLCAIKHNIALLRMSRVILLHHPLAVEQQIECMPQDQEFRR